MGSSGQIIDAGGWQVELGADHERAAALLDSDRILNGYTLADLEPPLDAFSSIALATPEGAAEPTASCLVLDAPHFTVIVPGGDTAGVAAILDVAPLPDEAHLSMPHEHRSVMERVYRLERISERFRMAVTPDAFCPAEGPSGAVQRLGPDAVPALLELYAPYEESAFAPAQMDGGVFYGVWDGARLLAAAGTHVVGPRRGLAAVGNVYTRPDARGRGLAAAVTSAVTADLLAAGCRDIFLSVDVENPTAVRVYERLGFRVHCRTWEAHAVRR